MGAADRLAEGGDPEIGEGESTTQDLDSLVAVLERHGIAYLQGPLEGMSVTTIDDLARVLDDGEDGIFAALGVGDDERSALELCRQDLRSSLASDELRGAEAL